MSGLNFNVVVGEPKESSNGVVVRYHRDRVIAGKQAWISLGTEFGEVTASLVIGKDPHEVVIHARIDPNCTKARVLMDLLSTSYPNFDTLYEELSVLLLPELSGAQLLELVKCGIRFGKRQGKKAAADMIMDSMRVKGKKE